MKKLLILALFLILTASGFTQRRYQYVIIPTSFPGIASGFNPYGVSSSLQKTLNEKSIKSVFQQNTLPDDYCKTLTAHLEKLPNLFRSKLRVELRDCRNQIIWSSEGMGISKDFREGYAEAIADALKEFDVLPVNQSFQYEISSAITPPVETKPAAQETPVKQASVEKAATPGAERIYQPGNLYYNYTYFIDVIENENGIKQLMIINGELLGYQNLETIATLSPSGLENVYTVEWVNADQSELSGVANLTDNMLKISLRNGDEQSVINLQKY